MRRLVWMTLLLAFLAGCESDEEKCNNARVAAHDAWDEIAASLTVQAGPEGIPVCEDLDIYPWGDIRQAATRARERVYTGSGSDRDLLTLARWRAVEEHNDQLVEACRSTRRAADSSTGAAVAARDNARAAVAAVRQLDAGRAGVLERFDETDEADAPSIERGQHRVLREALVQHFGRLDQLSLSQAAETADALSTASWEACQSVDP